MKSLSKNAIRLARILIAIVFVLNAIGIIDHNQRSGSTRNQGEHVKPFGLHGKFQ